MANASDVLVIGAGVIGCAIARELARRRVRVRIFEARSIAAGATYASAGVLAPRIECHDREALLDLTLRSLEMYDAFVQGAVEESGITVDYRRCGTLEVALDDDDEERLRRGLPAGAPDVEWLDAEGARALEPLLPEGIRGAVHVPSHGYVAVPALTEALAWAALRHGAELETGRRIASIHRHKQRLEVRADDGSTWSAATVVVAAGSWSGQIEPRDAEAVSVKPVRGQLLRLAWRGTPPSRVLWGTDCYVVPWRDGTVLVGATMEDVGFDERATAAGVRDLLDAVCELLPAAWGATFIEARAGLRPATPDGLPLIGPSPSLAGLVYATGHYRNGILLAPLTAAVVADLIVEGRRDPALDVTSPGRGRGH